jgi:ABC1 atypical kinase-like domain
MMWYSTAISLVWIISTATADTPISTSIGIPKALTSRGKENKPLQDARTCHVRQILNERVDRVLSGTRQRDFSQWAKKEDLTVFSMHGSEELNVDLDFKSSNAAVLTGDDCIFPEDKLNLDLIPVETLPSMYQGKPQHLLDLRPPTMIELFLRSLRLGINFSPIMLTVLLAVAIPSFREGFWFKWVANCLAASGPAFIKWGQWASTRSDMFPETLCQELAQLHSAAPSHSWSHTQKMMESSLGLPRGALLDVFDSFEPKPVASGSIAQVHKAVLKADNAHIGTVVAVKVRHPNVARLIDMDFRLMKLAATLADCIPAISWLHVRDSVEQFSHTMAAQAHLNVEGHHLELLNHNFRHWKHINFPRPIYASSSVIIETFEPGRIVTEILDMYDAMARQQLPLDNGTLRVEEVHDRYGGMSDEEGVGSQFVPLVVAKFIVTNGLALYLKMLLVDNLMHADLHVSTTLRQSRLCSTKSITI